MPWRYRKAELEAYKRAHGDCNVPDNYDENPKLAKWVARQRSEYFKLKNGKKSALKHEHLLILEGMGFEWRAFSDYSEIESRQSSIVGGAIKNGRTDPENACPDSPAVEEAVDAVIVSEEKI